MKRKVGYAIASFMLAAGLSAPLPAQELSPQKSDLIDPAAMEALNNMGTYLRSLKDFQVQATVTSEVFDHQNTWCVIRKIDFLDTQSLPA